MSSFYLLRKVGHLFQHIGFILKYCIFTKTYLELKKYWSKVCKSMFEQNTAAYVLLFKNNKTVCILFF